MGKNKNNSSTKLLTRKSLNAHGTSGSINKSPKCNESREICAKAPTRTRSMTKRAMETRCDEQPSSKIAKKGVKPNIKINKKVADSKQRTEEIARVCKSAETRKSSQKHDDRNDTAILNQRIVVGSTKSLINSIKEAKRGRKTALNDSDSQNSCLDVQCGMPTAADLSALDGHPDLNDGVVAGPESSGDEQETDSDEEPGSGESSASEDDYNMESDSNQSEQDPEVSFKDTSHGNETDSTDEENSHESDMGESPEEEPELDCNDPRVKRLLNELMSEKEQEVKSKKQKKRDKSNNLKENLIKSPSDTTIYAPALNKEFSSPNNARGGLSPSMQRHINNTHASEVMDEISDFVEKVRRERHTEQVAGTSTERTSARGDEPPRNSTADEPRRTVADEIVIQAEKFKSSIIPPKGTYMENDKNSPVVALNENIGELINMLKMNQSFGNMEDNDDDFMHVSCHIDENLRLRIGKEEFIDLDRLLPRSRAQVMSNVDDEIQVIKRDGATYVLPNSGSKESRITGVRKWEQAFRVYAAIYSEQNPGRSAEIWQYVHIINTAAQSYAWENVAFYDFTFRQLMHKKPGRSWAKIYTQMWNIALTDHLHRPNYVNNQGRSQPHAAGGSISGSAGPAKHGDWRDRCCWRFNKGKCSKWNCKFDHRCSNKECGAYSHGANTCNKKRNDSGSGGNNSRNNGQNGKLINSK